MTHYETQDAYSIDTPYNYFLNTGVYQYIWGCGFYIGLYLH